MSDAEQHGSRERDEPHGSMYAWSIWARKSFKLVAPGLKPRGKNQDIVLIALVVGVLAMGGFAGFATFQQTHPPLNLIGVCPAPAQIGPSGCSSLSVTVTTVSGTVTAVTHTYPAGYYEYQNGTRFP